MKLKSILICMLAGVASVVAQHSPYVTQVYDFVPAPGQFVNELPEYEEGDTKEDMIRKVESAIAGDTKGMISLGGYGGYVVLGFDHTIVNVPGEYDFKVWGNAFYSADSDDPDRWGGSCEPGIVQVSFDANGNGLPDDEWYELAGSEYHKPETIKNYSITYFKPDENKEKTPSLVDKALSDTTYIRWTDNRGGKGFVSRNAFHAQPYYPQWTDEETLVFRGTKLADNYVDKSGKGSNYVLYAYDWGYADNHPDEVERSAFKIEWAVNAEGNSVDLPGVDFVKVYTGVNQYCGWLGETSTEVRGAEDLHVDAQMPAGNAWVQSDGLFTLLTGRVERQLIISTVSSVEADIWHCSGKAVGRYRLEAGTNCIDCSAFAPGVYVLTGKGRSVKFLKL